MEDCITLKRRVHDLIKVGALAFDDEDVPDVNRNHLPDYQRPKINAVDSDLELQIKKDVKVICMLMGTVYEALFKAGMLEEEQEKEEEKKDREGQHCLYHKRFVGHPFKIVRSFLGWYKK